MLLLTSQIVFSILVLLTLFYDVFLLISVLKKRFHLSNKDKNYPIVYLVFMTFCGIVNKISHFLLVDGYVIAYAFGGDKEYEEFRQLIGKQVTLTVTWGYLTPIYFNWLSTIHRLVVVLFPMKSRIFNDRRLLIYCPAIMMLSFIDLLIPYYSSCSINFHAHPATWVSACAPDKHWLTWFQNKYTIYFPVSAMTVNFSLILYMRLQRGALLSTSSTSSESHLKREKAMIRQTVFTATYLSIYEIGSLYIRLLPNLFNSHSPEFKDIFYFIRILSICSLNFFVYFVITISTRRIFLQFYGLSTKKITLKSIATVTMQ